MSIDKFISNQPNTIKIMKEKQKGENEQEEMDELAKDLNDVYAKLLAAKEKELEEK